MDILGLKWTEVRALLCSLLLLVCLHGATGMSGCLNGQDVIARIRENSTPGKVIAELMFDTTSAEVQWTLGGRDADWFVLDKQRIRLNSTADRLLDREDHGSVLMAELLCYQDVLQAVYRIIVEVINENDNSPVFAENTDQTFTLSELLPVNTVAFTVQASDADNDKIIYSIDQTSPDADYFRMKFPNSGQVLLSKSLDYERKDLLTVTIHASEVNTAERFNTSTNVKIYILDADDQNPQFLPCKLLYQNETTRICDSPVYVANITEGEEDILLDFSPGPIYAVDGDKGINTALSYAIVSGDDEGCLLIDGATGEMKLIQGVKDRLKTPLLQLRIMVYQNDDPRKYSFAMVTVRILAVNYFQPEFDHAEYHGFVIAGQSHYSLVQTYGNKALMLHIQDKDFEHGFNPMISFALGPSSNHTEIYQITPEGLLIARIDELRLANKHIIEVVATDQESGDAALTTVVVWVLAEGQSVPGIPAVGNRLTGCVVGKALFLSLTFLAVLGSVLGSVMYVVKWLKRRQHLKRDALERGCVAQGKHPNVSLQWFQLVSQPHIEMGSYKSEEYGTCNPAFSFTDKSGHYTKQDAPSCPGPVPVRKTSAPDSGLLSSESMPDVSSQLPTFQTATETQRDNQDSPRKNTKSPISTSLLSGTLLVCPKSVTTSGDKPPDPVHTVSSQSTASFCPGPAVSAEMDKPPVKTPRCSPLSSIQAISHPPTLEKAPAKTKLPKIHSSPLDSEPLDVIPNVDQPSTSLAQSERSESNDNSSTSPDRRSLVNSGNNRDRCPGGDEERDDDDDDELASDEEELLRVMARCNPVFITLVNDAEKNKVDDRAETIRHF